MVLSTQNGVNNLLQGCVHVEPGDRVLLVLDTNKDSVYQPCAGLAVAERLQHMQVQLTTFPIDGKQFTHDMPDALSTAMQQSDHTIFLSQIGDFLRFMPQRGDGSKTICYSQSAAMLDSPFSSVCHQLMSTLRNRLETELEQASSWRISCSLGTDISGTFDNTLRQRSDGEYADFQLDLFPVTTFRPVSCHNATGNITASRWLVPGAAEKVKPGYIHFDQPVDIAVADGVITDIKGDQQSCNIVSEHYDRVSQTLAVKRDNLMSWHAGINPLASFSLNPKDNLVLWETISFASPRYLHFHTCGDQAPGEVALSVFNPTIWIDQKPFWQDGNFVWLQRTDNRTLIEATPNAGQLLEPSACIAV